MANGGRWQPIEEQTLSLYHRKHYYPVKIGDFFKDQYRIIAKLGYGAYSTMWLARDERSKQYISLKVCVQNDTETSQTLNEVKMLQRLGKISQEEIDHPGVDFTRLANDIFEIDGPSGRHYCIAAKPQGSSLRALQERFANSILPKILVKSLIQRLFFAVNWLHAACGVVHTEISPQNILMEAQNEDSFKAIEDQESQNPSIPITSGGATIYESRASILELCGSPILTDFGSMRLWDPPSKDWWMPDILRAPEVLLKLPWGFQVDMWSVGVMTLELLEGKNLFDPIDHEHNQYVLPLALAQYIGYLGLPPPSMLEHSPLFHEYFDEFGSWASEPPIPQTSLEDFVTTIPPGEEKEAFLKFIRKMLTWDPDARATSNEILEDEWLRRPVESIEMSTAEVASSANEEDTKEQK